MDDVLGPLISRSPENIVRLTIGLQVRTGVAVLAMFGQQITGQAFPSQYGVIFYQSQGFGDRAFLFNVIQNVASLVAVIITWFYIDAIGRRPALLGGGSMMAVFLFILAGMGSVDQSNFNQHEQGAMVASLMLFQVFFNLSWAPWCVLPDPLRAVRR